MPKCPICNQEMKTDLQLDPNFFRILQFIIDTITRGGVPPPPKFGCCGQVLNPKFHLWEAECREIDRKNRKNLILNTLIDATGMFPSTTIPYPPAPPKKIPCKNNFKKKATGKYNQNIVKRKPHGPLYDAQGQIIVKFF